MDQSRLEVWRHYELVLRHFGMMLLSSILLFALTMALQLTAGDVLAVDVFTCAISLLFSAGIYSNYVSSKQITEICQKLQLHAAPDFRYLTALLGVFVVCCGLMLLN